MSNARAIETTTVVVLSSVLEAGCVAEDAAVHRPAREGFARLWLLIGLFLVLASAFLVASWPVHTTDTGERSNRSSTPCIVTHETVDGRAGG